MKITKPWAALLLLMMIALPILTLVSAIMNGGVAAWMAFLAAVIALIAIAIISLRKE